MTVFITGGCKNGKSTFALQCALSLSERRPRYYVATMEPPCDADELERIRIHRAARAGKGFVTLEQGRNLPDETATERIAADLGTFLGAVEHAVVVSDYLYGDGIAYDPVTERYRRGLAYLDRFLAERCDCVVEICLGRPVAHKGRLPALEGKT